MDFLIPQQAKAGRLRVKKRDKIGRVYHGQDEIVVSEGLMNTRDMERELIKAADASDQEVVGIEVDTYGPHEVPAAIERRDPARSGTNNSSTFVGFRGAMASWPPESPLLRQLASRRKDSQG